MALAYTMTTTVSTASPSGCRALFHGTLLNNVSSFVTHGVDYEKLKECGGSGEFWATRDLDQARDYASLAEQQLLLSGGYPRQAIIAFNLSLVLVDSFQDKRPDPWLWLYSHGCRFDPACYLVLNSTMTNIEITIEG